MTTSSDMQRQLPINAIKTQVIDTLQHSDIIISADTGSGKSTHLPLWAQSLGRVLVIEPRRIACLALAQYLASQSASPVGKKIGYAIRFDNQYTPQTNVVFATPGVALRWLFEDQLAHFDVVMLDEFHERRWDTDLLLAILNKRKSHRLILTSATLNSASLASYTGAQEITAQGRCFPIESRYVATDMRLMPHSDKLDLRVKQALHLALSLAQYNQGDILVFLPGKKEIQQIAQSLARDEACNSTLILPLHAGSDQTVQRQALNRQPQRRIILATNVAETSLTIPNISCVIDSGLERRTHLRGGRTVLSLEPIARSSAIQRQGRAGRVMDGLCIQLFGEFAPLKAETPAQILREDLTEMVLSSACAQEDITQLDFINPLPNSSLQLALTNLQRINAIDPQNLATAHGKRIYPLPLDSHLAHLILSMPTPALQLAMIDLAAALCVNQSLYQLSNNAQQIEELNTLLPSLCDAELLIACVRPKSCEQLIERELVILNNSAIAEARQNAAQIKQAFDLKTVVGLKTANSGLVAYNRLELCAAIANAQHDLCFVKREKKRGVLANGYIEVIPAKNSRLGDAPDNNSNQAALILNTHAIPGHGTKETKTLATCIMPMPLATLTKLGFGNIECTQPRIKNNKILVENKRIYAGRTIESQLASPPTDQIISILTTLIGDNRLLKGLHDRLEMDIKAYQLYLMLNSSPQNNKVIDALPTPADFIHDSLVDLGVETLADLTLIEAQDISFEGIPEWERADFDQRHPQAIKLADIELQVEYLVNSKQIKLHYLRGQRKTEPKRWELPKFNGWKIRYQRASKVVDVR
jgi:HrpA-like RNA helicase